MYRLTSRGNTGLDRSLVSTDCRTWTFEASDYKRCDKIKAPPYSRFHQGDTHRAKATSTQLDMYTVNVFFLHEVHIYTKSAVKKKSAEFRTSVLKLIYELYIVYLHFIDRERMNRSINST